MILIAKMILPNIESSVEKRFSREAKCRKFKMLAHAGKKRLNQYTDGNSIVGFTFETAGGLLNLIFITACTKAAPQTQLQRLEKHLAIFDKASGLWSANGEFYTTQALITSIFDRL